MAFYKAAELGVSGFRPAAGEGHEVVDLPIAVRSEPEVKKWAAGEFAGRVVFRTDFDELIAPTATDFANSFLYQFPREIPYWLTAPAIKIWKNSGISFSNGNSYSGTLEFHYIRKRDRKGDFWVLRPVLLITDLSNSKEKIILEPWGFEWNGKFHLTPWLKQISSRLPEETKAIIARRVGRIAG